MFGSSSSSSNPTSTSTANPFGSANPFGGTGSIFGGTGPMSAANPPTTATFGGFGSNTSGGAGASGGNVFGSSSSNPFSTAPPSSSNVFGSPLTPSTGAIVPFGTVGPSTNSNVPSTTNPFSSSTSSFGVGSSSLAAPINPSINIFGGQPSSSVMSGTTLGGTNSLGTGSGIFGTSAPSMFGAVPSNTTTSTTSMFGGGLSSSSTQPTSIFGSMAPSTGTPSVFGTTSMSPFGTSTTSSANAPTSTGIFSSTTSPGGMLGTGGVLGGISQGTGSPPFSTTSDTESGATIILQTLSAMPAYKSKSAEELRLEDYNKGKKTPGYGPPTTQSSTISTLSSPFGSAPTSVSASSGTPFGAASFGSNTANNIFGQSSVANTPSTSIFGAPPSAATAFPSTQSTSQFSFPSSQSSVSSAQPPSFGTTSSLFAKPAGSVFSMSNPPATSANSGSIFGSAGSNPLFSNISANNPLTTTATPTSAMFPSMTNTTANIFPSTSSTTASSMFPSTGSNLFPSTTPMTSTSSAIPSFISAATTGGTMGNAAGLFPSNTPGASTSFIPTMTATPANSASNFFPSGASNVPFTSTGMNIATASTPLTPFTQPFSMATAAPTTMTAMMSTPSSNINTLSSPGTFTWTPSVGKSQFGKHPWLDTKPSIDNSERTPSISGLSSPLPMSMVLTGKDVLGKSTLNKSLSSPTVNNTTATNNNTKISPYNIDSMIGYKSSLSPSRSSIGKGGISIKKTSKKLVIMDRDIIDEKERKLSLSNGWESIGIMPSVPGAWALSTGTPHGSMSKNMTPTTGVSAGTDPCSSCDVSVEGSLHRVQLLSNSFYMSPPVKAVLKNICNVDGLILGKKGFGDVTFLSKVDLSPFLTSIRKEQDDDSARCDLLLDRLFGSSLREDDVDGDLGVVVFGQRSITLYPLSGSVDDDNDIPEWAVKPSMGSGLNVPAIVRLENCYPKATTTALSEGSSTLIDVFVERLRRVPMTRFISYEETTGLWTFQVSHF